MLLVVALVVGTLLTSGLLVATLLVEVGAARAFTGFPDELCCSKKPPTKADLGESLLGAPVGSTQRVVVDHCVSQTSSVVVV